MTLLQRIRLFVSSLDTSEFYRNTLIFIGINALLMMGILWYYFSTTWGLQDTLREVYKKDTESKELLIRLAEVKKQSEEVNTLLEQEKNFKIKNFFDDTVKKLNLSSFQKGDVKLSEESVLNKRYTEVTLQVFFQRIDTKQLCDLLQAIEQKPRIYTKDLTITKMQGAALSVTLTFATLTAQTDKKKS